MLSTGHVTYLGKIDLKTLLPALNMLFEKVNLSAMTPQLN